MHPYHKEILEAIEKTAADRNVPLKPEGDRYVGTTKPVYLLKTADLREIYDGFTRRHPEMTPAEFVDLLDSLSQGGTYNEYVSVGALLGRYPKLRRTLDPHGLDRWLETAQGWAEVDTICQSNFPAAEMLATWEAWENVLVGLAASENVHKRRASLVLLTRPLRESDDPRLAFRAFTTVDQLKGEKDILITKAVSWILRSLIKHHRIEVEQYLEATASTLPKIALRETRYKLDGGVKKKVR